MMKQITLILLAGMLIGCSSVPKYKDEISKVFKEREKALAVPIYSSKKPVKPMWREKYLALKSISVTNCPTDFQVAWVVHLQEWDRQANANPLKLLLEWKNTLFDSLTNDRLNETWREVEKIAAHYGVVPLHGH